MMLIHNEDLIFNLNKLHWMRKLYDDNHVHAYVLEYGFGSGRSIRQYYAVEEDRDKRYAIILETMCHLIEDAP